MPRTTASLLPLLLLLACGRTPAAGPVPPPSGGPADVIADIVGRALDADARMQAADSLYVPRPEILAEGRRRTGVPRYAGVEPGGAVVISSTRVDLSGGFAWAEVEYRWEAPGRNLFRDGRATLILIAPDSGYHWRIVHAHSSLAR